MDVREGKAKEYAEKIPYYQDRRQHVKEDFLAGWDAAVEYMKSLDKDVGFKNDKKLWEKKLE